MATNLTLKALRIGEIYTYRPGKFPVILGIKKSPEMRQIIKNLEALKKARIGLSRDIYNALQITLCGANDRDPKVGVIAGFFAKALDIPRFQRELSTGAKSLHLGHECYSYPSGNPEGSIDIYLQKANQPNLAGAIAMSWETHPD